MDKEFKKRAISSILLVPLSFFFIIKGSLFFAFFLTICFLVSSYEWHMMSKKKNYHIIGYIFLLISFLSAHQLRNVFGEESLLIFLFIILICVSTDIGGYVAGKLFKGPKLTKISPKKTYSGMIGGYFLSIIIINIYLINLDLLNFESRELTLRSFFIVILISSISQIGDIIISYFKRLSKVKDTGNIIPGHGGLLDRIDGMIFAFPFSYSILLLQHYF
tara:strand:- start:863 stop:1519 length:657 start_codon:yes stop_codon:yes gene_type:complete